MCTDSGESTWIARPWDTLLFNGSGLDPNVTFEASRKDAAGNWSAWQRAQVKTFPSPDGRFWGKILFPGLAAGSVRLRSVGQAAGTPLDIYQMETFASDADPHEAENPPPVGGFAPRDIPGPLVHERSEWGAKITREPYKEDVPVRITIHHTDTPPTHSLAESEREARFIQEFHQDGRGWDDIAYHFLIDADGNIIEGRPLGTLGAHTHYDNLGNVGIALIGTHDKPRNNPVTKKEMDALVTLVRWLVERYGIDPSLIRGHRDYVTSTDCPGRIMYAMLPQLRARVTQLLAQQPAGAAGGARAKRGPSLPPSAKAPGAWD